MRKAWTRIAACTAALMLCLQGAVPNYGWAVAAEEAAAIKEIRVESDMLLLEQGKSLEGFSLSLGVWDGVEWTYIPITTDMVSGYEPEKLGRQALTVSYGGVTTTMEVQVFSREEASAFFEKVNELVRIYYCMAPRETIDESFDGWTPENMRFTGKLTEANKYALFMLIGWNNQAYTKFEKIPEDGGLRDAFLKIPTEDMRQMLDAALVYDEASLTALSYYRADMDCFLLPYTDGWGGALIDLGKYATITQKENGNWLIQQRKPSPDAGYWGSYGAEIYQFDMEVTPDYRLVFFEIRMEKLTWKTLPAKTVYEKGEALDLSDAVITAHHGTGKSFDIPVTLDMVSGYDPDKTGKQTLTVTYGGQSITLDVTVTAETEDKTPVSIDDKDTGIKLETDGGVIPPDTVIQARPVTEGGNFTIINDALAQTSHKWVAYDISLLSNNTEIQPNGKVKITMPVPKGLNKNKMALFHVAEDGKLTQIPFTLDANKQNLIFETDHFSLYVVAETSESSNPPTGYNGQGVLPVAILLMAGAAVLLLRKRQTAR